MNRPNDEQKARNVETVIDAQSVSLQMQLETAEYILAMVLELRELARKTQMTKVVESLEAAYYRAGAIEIEQLYARQKM